MTNEKEYGAIREEMLEAMRNEKSYFSLLYTITVAVFAFAFTQKEPLIFLVPFTVIIPIYIMNMKQISSILRMGTYILVFHENNVSGWETRLAKYDESTYEYKREISAYSILAICSFVLCFWKIYILGIQTEENMARLIVAVCCLCICLYIIEVKRINYKVVKDSYIEKWQAIKDSETSDE